ncbi:hypothetical protein [Rhizobium sp. BK418]|uniref:hypothetical protein n=1 Tax=Rhizobium sp. BK418 TaxID=2512120 RepID=UPI0010533CD9|nr:hypothetical protein [Rhizobium sp. BK418]TCS04595.1 hypothetical protein EV281_103270 [Rhizobium sp. BK418]
MKVGYTEFSFGYAFTENLIRGSATAPTGAPVFPNLVQEATLGYDVQIGFPAVPLFFQYKLPELMTRASAFEIAGGLCPGLTLEFFRIALMRRDVSDQHRLLIDWEGRYPGQVFYAAPCLRDCAAFNSAYNTASVASRSILFSPAQIGPLPDDKVHTIAYKPGLSYGYFCSEPRQIEAVTFESVTRNLSRKFKNKNVRDFRATAQEVRQAVLEAASPVWRQTEDAVAGRVRQALPPVAADGSGLQPDREQAILDVLVAREIARIDMGIDLVIAQPR